MAEVQEWWQHGYPQYSIQRLEEMQVYLRLQSLPSPYNLSIGPMTEAVLRDEEKEEYRWENATQKTKERLMHTLEDDTWTYEHSFPERECATEVISVLTPSSERGEIRKTFFSSQSVEKWERGVNRSYSRTVTNGSTSHGLDSFFEGVSDSFGWLEVHFTAEGVYEHERVNYHGDKTNGETRHVYGDRSWGEVWVKGDGIDERKTWHKVGNREWGHTHGEACEKQWDSHYSQSPGQSKENRLLLDNSRYRGFRYNRTGRDYLKVEWEGPMSAPQFEQESEVTKDFSLPETLRGNVTQMYDMALESLSTLRQMVLAAPEFQPEFGTLDSEVTSQPTDFPTEVPALLSHQNSLQDLLLRLERLKRRVAESFRLSMEKYEGLHQPLQELAESELDTVESGTAPEDREQDLGRLNELREEVESVKEMAPDLGKIRAWIALLKVICEFTASKFPKREDSTLGKEEIEEASQTLYQIAALQEAALGRVAEVVSDPQDVDESAEFYAAFTPARSSLLLQLSLLLQRQSSLFRLVEKLKGKQSHDIATDFDRVQSVVASAPDISTIRRRTKSDYQSPISHLNKSLDSLSGRIYQIFAVVHPDIDALEDIELLERMGRRDAVDPLPLLVQRTDKLRDVSEYMGEYLDRLYRTVLLTDKVLSRVLKQDAIVLSDLQCLPELVTTSKELSEKTVRAVGESLLHTKAKQILTNITAAKAGERSLSDVVEELTINNDELDELLKQKSEEIVFLTKEVDAKEKKLRERQEELLTLRKFKSTHEDNTQALSAAQVRIRDLELTSGIEPTCSLVEGDVKSHCLRYLIELLRKRRHVNQSVLLHEWKSAAISPYPHSFSVESLTLVPSTSWPPNLETEYLTEADAKEMERADVPLAVERLQLIKSNPLLSALNLLSPKGLMPVTDYDFYTFLESAFREKLNKDDEDLFAGVRPSQFAEFLLEHEIKLADSKEKGCEHLLRMAMTLEQLYRSRQPYAIFAARMMHVLDPHPATLEAEVIVLQHWQRLAYTRKVENQSLACGGEVPLEEVLDTYYPELTKDPASAQVWLAAIRPAALTEDRYGLHLLAWKLRSTPCASLESLSSPIQRNDFSLYLRDVLDLHLPKTVFAALWTHIRSKTDTTPQGLYSALEHCSGGAESVKVSDFLNGLLDAHEWQRKRVARRVMKDLADDRLDRSTFYDFVCSLDITAKESWVSELADQLTDLSPSDPFAPHAIVQLLATHPPKPLQSLVVNIERLHSSLEVRTVATLLDFESWETPVKRTRLIRTTETVLRTVRTQLKTRRRS